MLRRGKGFGTYSGYLDTAETLRALRMLGVEDAGWLIQNRPPPKLFVMMFGKKSEAEEEPYVARGDFLEYVIGVQRKKQAEWNAEEQAFSHKVHLSLSLLALAT
eukprot:3533974-Rhodomonas_salina.1